MGLFGGSKQDNTTTFGGGNMNQPNNMMGMGGMGMGGMGMGMGMDPTMMMMQSQNPMMQQAANDPVLATSKLLQMHDPMSMFIVSQNLSMLMELMGEIMLMCMKDFFSGVNFKQEGDAIKLDVATMPAQLQTLSSENLALTLQKVQAQAQQILNQNQQQMQMFLMAHQQGASMMQQNQPGFFGSLLGGMLGNQVQQQGGVGNMMQKGAAVGGAALL
tara:strand:+ start:1253 stop:1900 length:648 start_codon:yes stop_codon:yes gene_type:complete